MHTLPGGPLPPSEQALYAIEEPDLKESYLLFEMSGPKPNLRGPQLRALMIRLLAWDAPGCQVCHAPGTVLTGKDDEPESPLFVCTTGQKTRILCPSCAPKGLITHAHMAFH